MKSNIYIYQTRIPKYREPFFANLISLGNIDNIDYKIIVDKNRLELFRHESNMSQGVINIRIRKLKLLGRELHFHQKVNLHKGAELVVCEYGLKNVLVYYLLFLRRPKIFAFWGHGQTTTRDTLKIESLLQRKMLQYADFFFAYTESCSNYITSLGFPSSRIQVLNNSIDTKSLYSEDSLDSRDLLEDYLDKFNLEKDQEILLYLGSLEKDKRIDFVLDAFENMSRVRPGLALFICSQDNLEGISSRGLPKGVFLLGEANNEMKITLSKLCSLILNPGRVGLIAVDSFALKIPIATTNWDRHAPEFSYLKNEINCLITENDLESYVQGCLRVLDETGLRENLISGCLKSADDFTVEKMAANFHSGVLKCLAL